MKLAEALLLRSDQQKMLDSMKQRINANVLVQEGDSPSENPLDLIQQAFNLNKKLQSLILKINQTNAQAILDDGRTMLSVLQQREMLIEQHRILIGAITSAQKETDRYSVREIKWQKVVSVSELQKQADDVSLKIRTINILIQENNWKLELI